MTTNEPASTVILGCYPENFETCSVVHTTGLESTNGTITHEPGVKVFVVPPSMGDDYDGAYCTTTDGSRVSSPHNYQNIVRA